MSALEIQTVTTESYVVDGVTYKSREDADAAVARLANVQKGMDFVAKQYPELKPRAARTKANLIGEYLDFLEAGEPELSDEEKDERIAKAEAKAAKASGEE